jgi:hypothetical protein
VVANSQAVTTQRDAEGVESSPEPTELKFVGPATATVLETASFGAAGIRDREVSFGMLLDAGVNPGVAARIRREHSLPWSFDTEADRSDLDRRSDQVRGLNDGERDWVAASTGDWADGEADEPDASGADRDDEESDEPADPQPDGEWPETATPDDDEEGDASGETDPRPDGTWPETATPDDHDRSDTHGDDPSDTDDGTTDGVGPWPETARPGGFADEPGEPTAVEESTDSPETTTNADPTETTTGVARQATADGSGDPVEAETAWRERSAPVSVTELGDVDGETRETLAAAGITSVRSLATADPAAVAAALNLSEERIATLRETARSFLG